MANISGWFRYSSTPRKVQLLSELHEIKEHFVTESRRSARCLGRDCYLCNFYKSQTSWVFVGRELSRSTLFVFRLTKQNTDFALRLAHEKQLAIGTIIEVSLESKSIQNGLRIVEIGHETAQRIDATNYVRAIGVKSAEKCTELLRSFERQHQLQI